MNALCRNMGIADNEVILFDKNQSVMTPVFKDGAVNRGNSEISGSHVKS